MNILEIDNKAQFGIHTNIKIAVMGKKAVIIEEDAKIIPTKGFLPHIKSKVLGWIEKYCSRCKRWRPIKAFNKSKYAADGYKDVCRDCDNARRRIRYAKTKAIT